MQLNTDFFFLYIFCTFITNVFCFVTSFKNSRKVIIIGAGPSGIAAATRLYENNVQDILILEAENRIGGRINTVKVSEGNFIDLGAQWIHGQEDNIVYELVKNRDLYTVEKAYENAIFVQSSGAVLNSKIKNIFLNVFNEALEFNTSIPSSTDTAAKFVNTGDYYTYKINELLKNANVEISDDLKNQFIEWFLKVINGGDAAESSFDVSMSTFFEYKECEGENLSWKNAGYSTILSILLEKTNNISNSTFLEKNVIKNTTVTKISLDSNNKVKVFTDNKEYVADHVIVTVSLGVLKENHEQLFQENPLSEEKVKTIKGLAMGTAAKMFLRFPYHWWPNETESLTLLWTNKDKEDYGKQGLGWLTELFAFYKTGTATLTLQTWLTAASARTMEQNDENEVKTRLLQVLNKFFGDKYTIPEPQSFWRSTWFTNRHFRGTYSYRSLSTNKMNVKSNTLSTPILTKNNTPIILFAGEATHPHFYSTVHGAIETGWREADRLLSSFSG